MTQDETRAERKEKNKNMDLFLEYIPKRYCFKML